MLYLIRDATGKTISTYVEHVGPQADVHLLRLILLPIPVVRSASLPAATLSAIVA